MSEHPHRVLVLHASDELYGSDRVLYEVVTRLDRRRLEPLVVLPADVPGGGALSTALASAGISVERHPLGVLRRRYLRPDGVPLFATRLAADCYRLSRLAREREIRLIYTNTVAVQAGGLVARLLGIPHVWHVHEIVERPAPVARLLRWSLRANADRRIAVSQAVADWIGGSGTCVIHNAISEPPIGAAERQALRRGLLRGRSGPLVGWVGRISTWKGHGVFLALARRAAVRWPQSVFVMAGGTVPGLERLAADLRQKLAEDSAGGRIVYLGHLADGPGLIGALDVLVACPTHPEPFGLVAAEALWQGVPVLAVRSGGLPEFILDGITGILVDDPDPETLIVGLATMFEKKRLAEMGRAARDDAVTRFSIDRFIRKVEAELLAAASQGRSAQAAPSTY